MPSMVFARTGRGSVFSLSLSLLACYTISHVFVCTYGRGGSGTFCGISFDDVKFFLFFILFIKDKNLTPWRITPKTLPRRWAGSRWTPTPPPPLGVGAPRPCRAPLAAPGRGTPWVGAGDSRAGSPPQPPPGGNPCSQKRAPSPVSRTPLTGAADLFRERSSAGGVRLLP